MQLKFKLIAEQAKQTHAHVGKKIHLKINQQGGRNH